jgi:Site-specific DNA methylase
MKVLSLFDGMSCGQIAFKELGIEVEKYYAYEIDKYAIQVTQHNFPATEQGGDVFKADFTKYEGIDWLVGGSPCFASGTMVKTEDGFKEIQDIVVGDKVLTHTGNYKKVTKVMTKISDKYCILSGENMEDIVCTPNHRFYTKQMIRVWDNQARANKRTLSNDFSWTSVDKFVCIKNDSQTIKEQTYISCILTI